mmetsp:Transcript_22430/g.58569  ORF Transcript_22430/g.58569 Transcript_22430/m.58569 type:complete len:213 (+) Transcript_22430:513-1151(+)
MDLMASLNWYRVVEMEPATMENLGRHACDMELKARCSTSISISSWRSMSSSSRSSHQAILSFVSLLPTLRTGNSRSPTTRTATPPAMQHLPVQMVHSCTPGLVSKKYRYLSEEEPLSCRVRMHHLAGVQPATAIGGNCGLVKLLHLPWLLPTMAAAALRTMAAAPAAAGAANPMAVSNASRVHLRMATLQKGIAKAAQASAAPCTSPPGATY